MTANGGSTAFFGPYTLNVGCSNDYVTYADNAAFVTSVSKLVGDDKASVYTFELPTTDRAYCQILTTEIVNADGSTWTGDAELSPSGSQPYTVFDLVDNDVANVINFKIKTTFSGSFTHTSAQSTITLTCGSSYPISAASTPTSPQFITFDDSSVGYTLPAFTTSQQTGCPTNQIQITGSADSLTTATGLEEAALVDSDFLVKPSDNTAHAQYTFYVKVSAYGGSSEFFGPFELNVGCQTDSVTFTDNVAFSATGNAKEVGDSVDNVYTFA